LTRDSRDLSKHKAMYPTLKELPDKHFSYINGSWFIDMEGLRKLAFVHKRLDLLKIAEEASKK